MPGLLLEYEAFMRLLGQAISAGLTRTDSSGHVFPVLAREVPSLINGGVAFEEVGADEHLVVEYHLRNDLSWHDGAPLGSSDILFS